MNNCSRRQKAMPTVGCAKLERGAPLEVLAPAIELAEDGFAVQPLAARQWAAAAPLLARHAGGQALLVDGRSPRAGEVTGVSAAAATVRRAAARRGAGRWS